MRLNRQPREIFIASVAALGIFAQACAAPVGESNVEGSNNGPVNTSEPITLEPAGASDLQVCAEARYRATDGVEFTGGGLLGSADNPLTPRYCREIAYNSGMKPGFIEEGSCAIFEAQFCPESE